MTKSETPRRPRIATPNGDDIPDSALNRLDFVHLKQETVAWFDTIPWTQVAIGIHYYNIYWVKIRLPPQFSSYFLKHSSLRIDDEDEVVILAPHWLQRHGVRLVRYPSDLELPYYDGLSIISHLWKRDQEDPDFDKHFSRYYQEDGVIEPKSKDDTDDPFGLESGTPY